ncbi:hypothetical protein [Cohnella pontilimi]|nr:hypothetical protein [Cohnella pontilimi]
MEITKIVDVCVPAIIQPILPREWSVGISSASAAARTCNHDERGE